jgi:hypothetical protein
MTRHNAQWSQSIAATTGAAAMRLFAATGCIRLYQRWAWPTVRVTQ